jgi:predicted GH43/DUF377 family glycosyl hydrolase
MDSYWLMIATIIIVIIIVILLIIIILISNNEKESPILESDFSLSADLNNVVVDQFETIPIKDRLHGSNKLGMYNLSVHKHKNGYEGVIRASSSDGCKTFSPGPLFSYVYYINLNNTGNIINTKLLDLDYKLMVGCTGKFGYETNGVEDPKLFVYRGEQWVVGNVLGHPRQPDLCKNAICIFKVKQSRETFKILSVPENVNPKQTQKNWSFFEHEGDLLCEYSISPHVILRVDTNLGETKEIYRSGKRGIDVTNYSSLRGGANSIRTNIKGKEYYLNIGHVTSGHPHDYKQFFYIFDVNPPFEILGISEPSKLDAKARIQFAAGISEFEDNIYVSYGISDCYNRISIFSKDKIQSLFPNLFS